MERGVIQQHDFRSLLRLLGRTLTEDEVRGLLNCLDPLDPDERLGSVCKPDGALEGFCRKNHASLDEDGTTFGGLPVRHR